MQALLCPPVYPSNRKSSLLTGMACSLSLPLALRSKGTSLTIELKFQPSPREDFITAFPFSPCDTVYFTYL